MLLSAFVTSLFAVFAVQVAVAAEKCKTCGTSNAKLILPAGQKNLTAPTSDPSFVLLAIGFQNYTCNAAGTYK